MECPCCFEEETLPKEMLACPVGHSFCQHCIRRYVKSQMGEYKTVLTYYDVFPHYMCIKIFLGEAKYTFACLAGICDKSFTLETVQKVVPPAMFSKLLRKVQEEEVRMADIPNLVSCPFCSFAKVIDDNNVHLFQCENPECLRESCRLLF